MKLNYYPETDSLYIDLSSKPSRESVEVSEGVVIDYDEDGRITGIDVDNATHKINHDDLHLLQHGYFCSRDNFWIKPVEPEIARGVSGTLPQLIHQSLSGV
jgi:uncharacterized protein YuzE